MIDQSSLPFSFRIFKAKSCEEVVEAIKTMKVRGTLTISIAGDNIGNKVDATAFIPSLFPCGLTRSSFTQLWIN